jgi:hypothetical protein
MAGPRPKSPDGCHAPEYRAWQSMKARCGNPRDPAFAHYGGRGIRVCQRWRESFANFRADMGPRPSPRHSLERRDNNGSYCPENCLWATAVQQARNRRNTRFLTVTLPVAAWAERTGLRYETFWSRLDRGMTPEAAVTRPLRKRGASAGAR